MPATVYRHQIVQGDLRSVLSAQRFVREIGGVTAVGVFADFYVAIVEDVSFHVSVDYFDFHLGQTVVLYEVFQIDDVISRSYKFWRLKIKQNSLICCCNL